MTLVLSFCLLAGFFAAGPRGRAMRQPGLGGKRSLLTVLTIAVSLALLWPAVRGADDAVHDMASYRAAQDAAAPALAEPPPPLPASLPAPLPPPLPISPRALAVLGAPDASGNWLLLAPDFARRLLSLFNIMKEKYGYEMVLLEGYRTASRQDLLAAGGAQSTRAAGFQSYHQYGLAADCAFVRDGKVALSEKDAWTMQAYRRYGAVAQSLGLHWGGQWAMADFGHVELRVPGTLRRR